MKHLLSVTFKLSSLSLLLISSSLASFTTEKTNLEIKSFKKVVTDWSKTIKENNNLKSVYTCLSPQHMKEELGGKKTKQLLKKIENDDKPFEGLSITARENLMQEGEKQTLKSVESFKEQWRHNFHDMEMKHTLEDENTQTHHSVLNWNKSLGKELTAGLSAGYGPLGANVGGKLSSVSSKGGEEGEESLNREGNSISLTYSSYSSTKHITYKSEQNYDIPFKVPLAVEGEVLVLYKKSLLGSFGYKFVDVKDIFKNNQSAAYKVHENAVELLGKGVRREKISSNSSSMITYKHSDPLHLERFLKEEEKELTRLMTRDKATLSQWRSLFESFGKAQAFEAKLTELRTQVKSVKQESASMSVTLASDSEESSFSSSDESSFLEELRDLNVDQLVYDNI